jgi:cyclophilin family peptidyl-prolyl cis-trans isomerase
VLEAFATAGQRPQGEKRWGAAPKQALQPEKSYSATLETSMGTITVDLWAKSAPKTVNSFVFLATQGFYDGVIFHRVIKGFMIQGGDPTGIGTGGPGYKFEDEPVTQPYKLGTLAMANAGPNTNGSQFFIVQGASGTSLPPQYTIFGQVISGMEVVNAIAAVPLGGSDRSTPQTPVTIDRVTVQEV